MKEQINSAVNAFDILNESFDILGNEVKHSVKSINDFEIAFAKAFPKRYQKASRFRKKVADLNTEYCEELFDANIFCYDCPIAGTHCEGSNCGNQMDRYFSNLSRSEFSKKLFEVFGGKFYSFSRRVKNELLKS